MRERRLVYEILFLFLLYIVEGSVGCSAEVNMGKSFNALLIIIMRDVRRVVDKIIAV